VSIRASNYARDVLEHDTSLDTRARLVLMLLAERCNGQTNVTYTGTWLYAATGSPYRSTMRRALDQLVAAGLITVEHRPGKASRIRFPLAATLSTPGAPTRRDEHTYPARHDTAPGAPTQHTRRAHAPRTGSVPGIYREPAAACDVDGCACDGSGWIHIPDGGRGYVQPCPQRKEAM